MLPRSLIAAPGSAADADGVTAEVREEHRQERIPTTPGHTDLTGLTDTPAQCRRLNDVLGIIGERWTVLILMALRQHPRRFNELRRRVDGISQQMLARTLRSLERDGTVVRTVHHSVPPQVEYALTPLGHSLADAVRVLGTWARTHLPEIERNRGRYDDQNGD